MTVVLVSKSVCPGFGFLFKRIFFSILLIQGLLSSKCCDKQLELKILLQIVSS